MAKYKIFELRASYEDCSHFQIPAGEWDKVQEASRRLKTSWDLELWLYQNYKKIAVHGKEIEIDE